MHAFLAIFLFVGAKSATKPAPAPKPVTTATTPPPPPADGKTRLVLAELQLPANAAKMEASVRALIADAIKESASLVMVEAQKDDTKNPKCIASDACIAKIGSRSGADFAIAAAFRAEKNRGVLDFRLVDVKTGAVKATASRVVTSTATLADDVVMATTMLVREMMPEAVGRLVLKANVDDAEVSVDGKARGKTPLAKLELAYGEHELAVEKPQFQPFKDTVFIDIQRDTTVNLTLDPNKDFLEAYKAKNGMLRALAWTGVGFAIAGAAGTFALRMAANSIHDNLSREFAALDARQAPVEDYAPVNARARTITLLDGFTWGVAAIGVAGVATAIACFIVGENPSKFDKAKKKGDKEAVGSKDAEAPTFSVSAGIGSVSVRGAF